MKSWLIGKDPDAGKDWGQEEKETTEDEMVWWHHQLSGREFEQILGIGGGQGGLACCIHGVTKSQTQLRDWTDWLMCSTGLSYACLRPTFYMHPMMRDVSSLVAQMVKNLPAMWETFIQCLGGEGPLEKGMATHCRILIWRIPMDRGAGGLQSKVSQMVGHNWATNSFTLVLILQISSLRGFECRTDFGSSLSLVWLDVSPDC